LVTVDNSQLKNNFFTLTTERKNEARTWKADNVKAVARNPLTRTADCP
jgi:hypothetical protein